jgi:hypothetical protein
MKARYLYSEIANALIAYQNCVESGNTEWRDNWEDRLEELCKEFMPSGSGFDNGTKLEIGLSRPKFKTSHAGKLVFQTAFHHMDEAGGYDGWTNHLVTVTPSFDGFNLRIGGRNRNDIKDYIGDAFHEALCTMVIWEGTEDGHYVRAEVK